MAPKRKLQRITSWREVALAMYRKVYGRRCVRCSQIVEEKDAVLYRMSGLGDELILAHRNCKP
jgi:hypothetical protein